MLGNFPIVDTLSIFYAIVVESLPFVTLGVLISGVISLFVSDELLIRYIPKKAIPGHIAIACVGFIFPVCECGNIPLARRLISKGVPLSQVVTFLLAAPIFNPIVIIATLTAFRFAPQVVVFRVVIGLAIAVIVGLIISRGKNNNRYLTENMIMECKLHKHSHKRKSLRGTVSDLMLIIKNEVFLVFTSLLLGAFIASVVSTISRDNIIGIATSPILSIVAMMILAFIMTICSTVDSFVALGYVGIFPLNAIVAFLVFGPMIDVRVLTMLSTTFKWKLVAFITFLVVNLVLTSSLMLYILGI